MKNKLIYMAALLLMAGCTADEMPDKGTDSLVPIRFSAGLEVQTRASFPDTDSGHFPAGSEVAVHIRTADRTPLYPRNVMTAGGDGELTGSAPMYYPRTGNVDIFALAPASMHTMEFDYSASISLQISADQSTRAGYTASDFMIGVARNVEKSLSPVPLTFYHMLSKLKVALVAADQTTGEKLRGATVTICEVPYVLAFQHYDVYRSTDWSDASQRANTVKVGFGTFNKTDITIGNDVSADFSEANVRYNDAVIIPHTFTGGKAFIRVTLSDGQVLEWKPAAELTFAHGKRYTYHVTVTLNGLSVKTAVDGWEEDYDPCLLWKKHALDMVKIPAGTFLMGSSDGSNYPNYTGGNPALNTTPAEPNRKTDETQHKVTLTKDFYISRYPITNRQFAAFLNANGVGEDGKLAGKWLISAARGLHWETDKWVPQAGYDFHPVVYVTWSGASEYARWVGCSLPTEAQWEYACRAGTTTAYSYGNTADGDYMCYKDSSSSTKAVGLRKPNPWGLYDMHGNVYEWCSDWYADNYGSRNAADAVTDPTGPESGYLHVMRGGGWYDGAQDCRSASRHGDSDRSAFITYGFRVVFVP